MPIDSYWECIDLANAILSSRDRNNTSTVFKAGEIGNLNGSIIRVFYEHLRNNGITLTEEESRIIHRSDLSTEPSRYCLVLGPVESTNAYKVCYLTTFAGTSYKDAHPIAKHLGIPISSGVEWHGISSIETAPHWTPHTPTFIFGIPVIASDLRRTGRAVRLLPGETERLMQLIDTKLNVSISLDPADLITHGM